MRDCALLLALALLLVPADDGAARADEIGNPPTVILISLDGVRHDQLGRGPFPGLDRIAAEGLRAERLVPVSPASTFPGHVSLATGTYPDVHGIVDNEFWDRGREERYDYSNDARWLEAEPLWAAAERQGVPAATYFWVGSETDWRGTGARHRMAPFDSRVGEREKVRKIAAWLDLPPTERPRLVMSWWHGSDRVGHREGPDHPDVASALAAQDRHLSALLAVLDARAAWDHTTLLVVSDHGMTTARHTVPLRETLYAAGVDARVETGSAISHVFVRGNHELSISLAEDALAGLEGVAVDRRGALPAWLRLAHPTRCGDLVVRALPGFSFRRAGLLARVGRALRARRGLHGYTADHPDMAGILLAMGRGVEAGARLGSARQIDVAPTIAALLDIEPPADSEGVPIPGIGTASASGAGAPPSASAGCGTVRACGGADSRG